MVSVKRISSSGIVTSKLRRRERKQHNWCQGTWKKFLALITLLVIYAGHQYFDETIPTWSGPENPKIKNDGDHYGDLKSAPKPTSVTDSSKMNSILTATSHLINIHITRIVSNKKVPTYYDGIDAEFCELDWDLHKQNPASVPKYRDLLNKGNDCQRNRVVINLRGLMEKIRQHDEMESNSQNIHILNPSFIFHESRAGSTLLANALAHFDPPSNRVYSEAGPPLTALKICGENYEHCSRETALQVFKDVMYLMGRVPSTSSEHRVFFKMQPAATTSIDIMLDAFPKSPWIFLYRDPEEVLVSHLLTIRHIERAKCLVSKRHPPHHVQSILDKSLLDAHDLGDEEYCAIFLSAICQCAIDALQSPGVMGLGRAFNYENILDKLITDILPNHFKIDLNSVEISRIRSVGEIYSKGGVGMETKSWAEDSSKKHDLATSAIHQASNDYLAFSYVQLENLARGV